MPRPNRGDPANASNAGPEAPAGEEGARRGFVPAGFEEPGAEPAEIARVDDALGQRLPGAWAAFEVAHDPVRGRSPWDREHESEDAGHRQRRQREDQIVHSSTLSIWRIMNVARVSSTATVASES